MLNQNIPWIISGYGVDTKRPKSPRISESSFRMAWTPVEQGSESQDLDSVPPSEYSSPILETNKPKPPRITSAPASGSTVSGSAGLNEHCSCSCHVENFDGMTPPCGVNDSRHYVTTYSRPASAKSTSSHGIPPRPASSASVVLLQDHCHGSVSRSRPQSAPPVFHRVFLKTQLLRQQLRAQLGSAPGLEYMGRHSRCYGHDHIHERLILNRPIPACHKCGARCNKYCGSRTSSTSRDIKQYLPTKQHGNVPEYDKTPMLIVAMRKNFQPLPKHNNVRQGGTPHFCNFVRNKPIQQRPQDVPPASHGHYHRRATQGLGWNSLRRNSASNRPRSSGTEGRPSSPSDVTKEGEDAESQIEVDTPGIPRVEIRHKTTNHLKQKAKPKAPKSAWAPVGMKDDSSSLLSAHGHSNPALVTMDTARIDVVSPGYSMVVPTNPCTGAKAHATPGSDGSPSDQQNNSPTEEPPLKIPQERPTTPPPQHPMLVKANDKKERQPIKKQKKTLVRERKSQEEPQPSSHKEDILVVSVNIAPEGRSTTPPPRATPVVPPTADIPSYKRKTTPTTLQRKQSYKSPIVTDFSKHKVNNGTPDAEQVNKPQFYEFSSSMTSHGDHSQKYGGNTWSQGRLALSQQSSRFELPMDMKMLETMDPTEYLAKYCVVTSKRQWLYEKIYLKHKDAKLGGLSLKGLDKALKEALVDTIDNDDVSEMIEMGQLKESTKIDQKLFIGIAAMAERVLYPKFLTEDTQNIKDHKKEKIECADFCGLEWKFHGIQVNPAMKKLLEAL